MNDAAASREYAKAVNGFQFHVHIPRVALVVVAWNRRVRMVMVTVWGRTPIFYRKERHG